MRKIALITGANKGIGLETARQLGREDNYTILVGARDQQRGTEATETLKSEGIDARFILIDPTDADSVQKAVREVEATFGLLDVLINNAGMMDKADFGPPIEMPVKTLRETFDINVFGTHQVTQAFWPLLNKSEAARLVNVSSALGSLTLQASDSLKGIRPLAYDASKAAIDMMTIHYAHGWEGTPHRANAAHPGNVKTGSNPEGEIEIEEGAKTSVELATLGADGPNGGFFHLGESVPW